MDKEKILNKINELCKARNWSINELTERTNLATGTIYEWYDSKKDRMPSLTAIEAICQAFNITLSVFFAENVSERLNAKQSMLMKLTEQLTEPQIDVLISLTNTLLEPKT